MARSRRFSRLIILVSSLLLCLSCKNEEEAPVGYVNFTIDPNSPMYSNLNTVGGYEYLVGGYRGVVVFRYSWDEFFAYERACPKDNETAVVVDTASSVILICPKCGSKFIYTDGTPIEGPAKSPLRSYSTHYDGNVLHVYN